MNGLSNLGEIYSEYSLAPTDDLIRFWRSRSRQAVEVMKASMSVLVEAHLPVNTTVQLLMVFCFL